MKDESRTIYPHSNHATHCVFGSSLLCVKKCFGEPSRLCVLASTKMTLICSVSLYLCCSALRIIRFVHKRSEFMVKTKLLKDGVGMA